jgi:uncharacterized protein YcgI (DUF1989 family)
MRSILRITMPWIDNHPDYIFEPPEGLIPRPLLKSFYVSLRSPAINRRVRSAALFSEPGGFSVDVSAGELVRIELLEAAQIVNLFMLNPDDPYERYWAHQTEKDLFFLRRYHRLWGTMPRSRPLLTLLEDSVTTTRRVGGVNGGHHAIFGGWGTPADWRQAGGDSDVLTTWNQFAEGFRSRKLDDTLLMDDVCLFQKTAIDPNSQRFLLLPSDARKGDYVELFVEVNLIIFLALSPYVDGSREPADLSGRRPRPIKVEIFHEIATPLPWPYPGMPYPNISRYLVDM